MWPFGGKWKHLATVMSEHGFQPEAGCSRARKIFRGRRIRRQPASFFTASRSLYVRIKALVVPLLATSFLAGCNHGPLTSGPLGSPDPFGYMKTSAVCKTTTPTAGANGNLVSQMTVRSDDGRCVLSVKPPEGGSYASFGVSPAPEHGKAFLYTLNGYTQITYTPTMGYAGNDTFTAILVRSPGAKRDRLTVTATVDATGVLIPRPAVTAPTTEHKETARTTSKARRTTTTAKKRR